MILSKSKAYGIFGTVLIHLLIILCLLFLRFNKTEISDTLQEGLAVNFGDIYESAGLFEPQGETSNTESVPLSEPVSGAEPDKALIFQNQETSISLTDKKRQDQKAATIRNQAANAFGTLAEKDNSQGSTLAGKGNQGIPNGDTNAKNDFGEGSGYGHFSLNGRSLNGGLPYPSFSIQEEGTVVVQITVNPIGNVIASSISLKGTTTDNSILRNAALSAAKKARFNSMEGSQNQSGTITYHFRLK
jgi:TonB family protein